MIIRVVQGRPMVFASKIRKLLVSCTCTLKIFTLDECIRNWLYMVKLFNCFSFSSRFNKFVSTWSFRMFVTRSKTAVGRDVSLIVSC